MQSVFMFDQVFLGEQWKQSICIPFKFKMEFEFAKPLQYTSFNWNHSHISGTYIKFQPSTHVIVHCTYLAPLIVVCRKKWNRNRRLPPSLKTPILNLVRKASNPPFIMSIKTQFPLFRLCMNRMITLCRFLPHS